jgi:hypothetical protein
MKTLTLGLLLAISYIGSAAAQQRVDGYTRQDGRYVEPYYRSSPNSSYNDNYSTRGNTNPYNGSAGTRAPTYNDRPPERNSGSSGGYGNSPSYGGNNRSRW